MKNAQEVNKITPKNRSARLGELRRLLDQTEAAHVKARGDLQRAHEGLQRAGLDYVAATKDYVDARAAFSMALRGATKVTIKERIEVTDGPIDCKDRKTMWSQSDTTPGEDPLEKACEKFLNMTYEEVTKSAIRRDDRGDITYYELADGSVVGSSYPGNSVILAKKA